jgi:hypothetical protein
VVSAHRFPPLAVASTYRDGDTPKQPLPWKLTPHAAETAMIA